MVCLAVLGILQDLTGSRTIPIASIIAPATLTVRAVVSAASETRPVPIPDFNGTAMAVIKTTESTIGPPPRNIDVYHGPESLLSKIGTATATLGTLLDIPAPVPNVSFNLNVLGPAIQCQDIPAPLQETILTNLSSVLRCPIWQNPAASPLDKLTQRLCRSPPFFVAWAANTTKLTGAISWNETTFWDAPTLGPLDGSGPVTLFVAFVTNWTHTPPTTWTILNCSLFNASYEVTFMYQGRSQTIIARVVEYFNSVEFTNELPTDVHIPYFNISRVSGTYPDRRPINYQAIMHVLGKLLVGSLSMSSMLGVVALATSAMWTNLAYTPELNIRQRDSVTFDSGSKNSTAPQPGRLAATVEQLFQNITLSLFSRTEFL